jgi:L-alanine-DL-glutamate epimerase-like enolase superfamily enzyme
MAKVLIEALNPYHLMFVEEPVLSQNSELFSELAQHAKMPIATGERHFTRWDYKQLFSLGGVDIIQPDPSHAGGIWETRKIAAMAETQFFTPMVIQMTAVGEESGSLETMLGKVATFYQAEVDSATENLTNTLNPILMIVVGAMIGWVLVSLYLPIFTMAGGIS